MVNCLQSPEIIAPSKDLKLQMETFHLNLFFPFYNSLLNPPPPT